MEPNLLANELKKYFVQIDSSPLLESLFSVSTVPIPPPLIILTNFGDDSYRYIRNFDEQPNNNQMRRFSTTSRNDEQGNDVFTRNSVRFDNFMNRAFEFSPFPRFPSTYSPPQNNFFPPSSFISRPRSMPNFPQPPSFPLFPLNSFPAQPFNIHKPKMPSFPPMNMFMSQNSHPSLIQIGSRNTNTKSDNSMQTGIIQISSSSNGDDDDDEEEDEDKDMNTSTMRRMFEDDSTPITEEYETTTFGNDDRIDFKVIQTLAG